MKLDKAPMSWRKFRIKAGKHAVWILFSAYTGFTFVAYFTPAKELARAVINFQTGPWETFWIIFYGFATYGNAGWMREQVCLYMCPYARFQSAMFDDDTLIISYDEKRGEPRGARSVGTDHHRAGLGDCINCTLCVQVCPTGIDIREGLQYECISCSACIDVCNDVMDKMNYPRGLIRYTTQNAVQGEKSRIIRPRILVYGFIMLFIFGALAYSLSQRIPLDMDIIRDRNQLYRETQGQIENVYTFKIMNMDETDHIYEITAEGIPELSLIFDELPVSARSGEVKNLVVKARADEADLESRSSEVIFTIQALANENLKVSKEAKFIGPLP